MPVPKFRFKDDDGSEFPEWENSNLDAHCEFYNGDRGKNYPSTNDLMKEGIPFINAGDLVNGKINLDSANKITREKYDTLKGAKIKNQDIVYCLRGSIGKNAIVEDINEGTVASSLVVIRARDVNYRYLFYFLNSDLEYKQRILNDEGCAQPNLSAKNVMNFAFPVPCIKEQQKIADCLSTVDMVISDCQSEVDAWEEYKRGVMQQLFSQKVRFKADDGSEYPVWKRKTLDSVCKSISSGKSKKTDEKGKYILYGSTGVIGWTDKPKYIGLHILIARVGSIGTINIRDGSYGVSDNTLVVENNNTVLTKYLFYQLSMYDLKKLAEGSTQPLITGKRLKSLIFSFPCLEEQQKIADCLSAFDEVIDKAKQKLEAHKQLKKGLLQQMFV